MTDQPPPPEPLRLRPEIPGRGLLSLGAFLVVLVPGTVGYASAAAAGASLGIRTVAGLAGLLLGLAAYAVLLRRLGRRLAERAAGRPPDGS